MSMYILLSEIVNILSCISPKSDIIINGVVIDSRRVKVGNLFVALEGKYVNGHNYLAQARISGASAALVSELQDDDLLQILVDDVVTAFGLIAAYWRQQCDAKVIGITGSNGKTTVKDMVSSVLGRCGSVLSTHGNLNNEIGVPLTLSRLDKSDDFAIIEMGANHYGEIANLVEMVKPDIAIINNVSPAHLEGFGSIEGVAEAKSEIFSCLTKDGIGIININLPFMSMWKQLLDDKQSLLFGLDYAADITAQNIQLYATSSNFIVSLYGECYHINLHLSGIHNVANALAATAICYVLQIKPVSIITGLAAIKCVPHRFQIRAGPNRSQIVDDTYNADLESYKQALSVLKFFPGNHWLVLGDFSESGNGSRLLHQKIGIDAKYSGIEKLFVIGTNSRFAVDTFGEGATHYEDMNLLYHHLHQELTYEITCLIKGSRSMKLDKLVDMLVCVRKAT
ncbi:MAG: UDP-N-acetylmuramoyl-tripeptide--D-alanyl-D-alanine ligase [Piscirickettsiaceae bacterium]|nr:UDP-N-acetylmuramoyl-tripeptide--D-alanyl-D-alanine ligase [Piscirickettsiaceae bacterium]